MQVGTALGNLAGAIGVRTEDTALVAELKAGSEAAFGELIAQYSQPLYSLIARSLQDPADASDITQEVFIKVFRSIRSFHGESSLRTWIYRIALREASNQRRWWTRHKRAELTMEHPVMGGSDEGDDGLVLGATLAAEGKSPYEMAANSQMRQRVEEALRKVPEQFRTVLVLREMEGFAYEEIAEILQVPAGTVKSRLTRGRAMLKQELVADGMTGSRTLATAGGAR